MKLVRIAIVAGCLVVGAASQTAAQENMNDSQAALAAVDRFMHSALSYCTAGNGEVFLFGAVIVPQTPVNGFAQPLVLPGGPAPGSVAGYYQFALILGNQGHYRSRIAERSLGINDADIRNGIEARYAIDLYAKSYRIYNVGTRIWSEWTIAGSLGQDVHYGSFTSTRRGGQWVVNGGFLINTNGSLQAAKCTDIPPG